MTQEVSATPTQTPSPFASEKDFGEGPCEEGLSSDEEEKCAASVTMVGSNEKLGAKLRRRKRDGKVVGRSSLVYSIYKKSRRTLQKKRHFYAGEFEDSPQYNVNFLIDWVQARHYQCRWFADVLVGRKIVAKEVADACMYEIESVLEWVLQKKARALETGSAALWVILLVQMNFSLSQDVSWEFDDVDLIKKYSVETLWRCLESKSDTYGQHTHVNVASIGKLDDHLAAATAFEHMLEQCNCPDELHPFRDSRTAEPRLYEGILKLQKALGSVLHLCGGK